MVLFLCYEASHIVSHAELKCVEVGGGDWEGGWWAGGFMGMGVLLKSLV